METSLVLPLWVEYIKALGTPTVALVAACIAGIIAHRQWVTSRNKLKLDFFDRRIEIYRLAVTLLELLRDDDEKLLDAMDKLDASLHSSRWLFSVEISVHLHELELRARLSFSRYSQFKKRRGILDAGTLQKEKEARYLDFQAELQSLDRVVGPYLSVEH